MHEYAERFAAYCDATFALTEQSEYQYQSLSACVLDCVYSLRTQYYAVTIPIVDRYAAAYMCGNRNSPGDTISLLLSRMEDTGLQRFASEVLKNHQVLGGGAKIPKEQVCYKLAQYLKALNIETIDDFRAFEHQELLEAVIRAVKGMGDAGVNYLFMLAGDPTRCKPDVHIHHCIRDACGCDLGNEDCQRLFTDAVDILRHSYPSLTVRGLDGIIWRAYQRGKNP